MTRIGKWQFDPNTNCLIEGMQSRHLDPIEVSVLMHLMNNAPNLVTRDALMEHNWPGVVVGDNVVHRVIARLRKALDDSSKQPAYIETIPRRGYRLIAPTEKPRAVTAGGKTSKEHCIAVLPFTNLDENATASHFGDGVSEDIINGLVRSSAARVIARTSSFAFRDHQGDLRSIGAQLGATHLVEGSVRIVDQRLRLNASLISAVDGQHVWSEQFEGSMEDVFALQDRIAEAVLGALNLYFTPRSTLPTTNPAAYTAYAKARRHTSLLQIEQAQAETQRALTLDPDYAEVHAHIASNAQGLVWYRQISIPEMQTLMGDHNDRALEIDPQQHLARATAAVLQFGVERNLQAGIDAYYKVLTERPEDQLVLMTYSFLLRSLGRFEDMLHVGRVAVSRDPMFAMVKRRLAEDLIWTGHLREGLSVARQCQQAGLPMAHFLFMADLLQGDIDEARQRAEDPDADWDTEDRRLTFLAGLAYDTQDHHTLSMCLEQLQPFATGRSEYLPGPEGVRSLKTTIAMLQGDLDGALDAFEESIGCSYHYFFHCPGLDLPDHFAGALDRHRHADFYAHPRFKKALQDYHLDADHLASIEVPPLPLPFQ